MTDSSPIHVVAAAITDARGRVLLARRTKGRDLAGLWEFPGGKVEPGESPGQALVRELDEELGIQVSVGPAVIRVPHAAPGKRLLLDVRLVQAWKGIPKGREGQALVWVPPHKLASYQMPPADRPVVAALTAPDRCLVTPPPVESLDAEAADAAWLDTLRGALASGVRRVQLRLPGIGPVRHAALVRAASALCHRAGADVLVNGSAEAASDAGVGLHLRSAQLRDLHARPVPAGRLLSASCHNLEELRHAERLGCDFAILGPIHPTATHPGSPGIGWESFAALRERIALPIYAIGGLSPVDIPTARQHGAQGIAAIRALWPAQ